jgi:hypothetical protein
LFFEIPEMGKGADMYMITTIKNELIVMSKEAYAFDSSGKLITTTEKTSHNYLGFPFLLKDGTLICSLLKNRNMLVYKNNAFSEMPLVLEDKSIELVDNSIFSFFNVGNHVYVINLFNKELFNFDESKFSISKNSTLLFEKGMELYRYYSTGENFWLASNINGVKLFDQNLLNLKFSDKIYEDYYISHVYKDSEGNFLLSTFDKGILIIPNLSTFDVLKGLKGLEVMRTGMKSFGFFLLGESIWL